MEYIERLVALAICCVSLGVLVGYWWGYAAGKAEVFQKWIQSLKAQEMLERYDGPDNISGG